MDTEEKHKRKNNDRHKPTQQTKEKRNLACEQRAQM